MNNICMRVAGGFVALIVGMTIGVESASGAYLVEWQDGDSNPFAGWAGDGLGRDRYDSGSGDGAAEATLDLNGGVGQSVGSHGTALEIDPSDQAEFELERDLFYTTDAALIGDRSVGYAGIRFDFYADADGDGVSDGVADAPERIGAFFHTAVDVVGGQAAAYWFYEIDSTSISALWNTYDFSFASGAWTAYTDLSFPGTEIIGASIYDYLDTVDQIGFTVSYREDNTTQIYGVDNFGLTVPEPETYMVLGMALLSIAIVFRKRISDSLAEARAMMHA